MHLSPTAAQPAPADDEDQPFRLIGGPAFNPRDPWTLPERRAMRDESGFGPLDDDATLRVLKQEAAIRRGIKAAQHMRICRVLRVEEGAAL